MRKVIFLVADGMGDYPVESLGYKTPLEVADTPFLDELAGQSIVGRCRTIPHGMPKGSDIANMSLLGYDPVKFYTGRGPIEAVAQGVNCASEDLIFRLNLCTISEFSADGVMIDYSADHIETKKAHELIGILKKEIKLPDVDFVPGFQYRHLMIQKKGALKIESKLLINPPHDIINKPIKDDFLLYKRSPFLYKIMKSAYEILKSVKNSTKANAIWLWGQGPPISLDPFEEKFRMKGCVISAVDLIKGLGYAAKMKVIEVEGATGLLDTNYRGKAEAVIEFLEKGGDFAYLHLEAPDECGHHADLDGKIKAIENFDKEIIGTLIDFIKKEKVLCVITCDHFTPVSIRTHTSDPVPFLVFDPKNKVNSGLSSFDERKALKSDIFIERGSDLLKWIIEYLECKR